MGHTDSRGVRPFFGISQSRYTVACSSRSSGLFAEWSGPDGRDSRETLVLPRVTVLRIVAINRPRNGRERESNRPGRRRKPTIEANPESMFNYRENNGLSRSIGITNEAIEANLHHQDEERR
jgi:hypothetical protein